MKYVNVKINGKDIKAESGMTILSAANQAGITIPNLCHNDELKPYGACRLCLVEITKGSRKQHVASCVYEVKEGLVVETNTPKIEKFRKMIIELLWPASQNLAKEFGITQSRFDSENKDCTLCGLCVRYCNEIKKSDVIYFKGRGINRKIEFIPELENECVDCLKCLGLCTGGLLDCRRM